MHTKWITAVLSTAFIFLFSGCGKGFDSANFASSGPASSEPDYKGTPFTFSDPIQVKILSQFKYRSLVFTASGGSANGLYGIGSPLPIPFAEFHILDSSGNQIQQGETDTNGIANFKIPKVAGSYTLQVFTRAYNQFLKISVLEDTYTNQPYFISKIFTVTAADIAAGTKDLSSTPSESLTAEADESIAPKIQGAAFNIMFDILLANEYIRRQIDKNVTDAGGVPSNDPTKWWVADKVTVYWKAGFNPRTYFSNDGAMLSFYGTGTNKLYILGGNNGDVQSADTDHFDDSVILHEYGHFLEDNYGTTASPGGSHNGNFVIDPRLSWSEGWANYFQSAVLSGAYNFGNNQNESLIPAGDRYHYYIDTVGYKATSNDTRGQIGIAFDLGANGQATSLDNVSADTTGTGTFREVSVARTLYKSTRATTEQYVTGKYGGGIAFKDIWTTFSGESAALAKDRSNPVAASLRNSGTYPLPNAALFNYLLNINVTARVGAPDAKWQNILTEEKQKKTTEDYAFYVDATGSTCSFNFNYVGAENNFAGVPRSNPNTNNDFLLYYHDGSQSETLDLAYTNANSTKLDLDLIIYPRDYVYFEDYYAAAGVTSQYIVKQSRRVASLDNGAESVSMAGLASGWYLINVKVNAYNKLSYQVDTGDATYTIKRNGVTLCGKER